MSKKNPIVLAVAVALLTWGCSVRADVIAQLYDFQGNNVANPSGSAAQFNAGITAPGYTAITPTTAFTSTTPGVELGTGANSYFRGSTTSTKTPQDLYLDLIVGGSTSTTSPGLVFQDIVPAFASSVTFFIQRNDPDDTWRPDFTTKVAYNGGAQITVDTGIFNPEGSYFADITYTMALDSLPTITTLDFSFYINASSVGGSNLRVNGITADYTVPAPEPASMALMALGGLFLGAVMMRRRANAS